VIVGSQEQIFPTFYKQVFLRADFPPKNYFQKLSKTKCNQRKAAQNTFILMYKIKYVQIQKNVFFYQLLMLAKLLMP